MPKIKILPEILSNKIAAGEVVERPASVVKEFIENAIDAQSSKIIIELEEGGRSLIRVSDNGCGMCREDALLSVQRYATSKIYNDSDLLSISTMGFRGEALPSIASVSRLNLVTRDNNSEIGTEVYIEGGKIINVSEAGSPVGTMVSVKQLFFNTPARRKFLKTINTEMGHVDDIVSAIALGRPNIYFKLLHNSKIIKNFPAVNDPLIRITDVLGKEIQNSLCPIEKKEKFFSISGQTSAPEISRSTSRGIYIFVNKRFVRDKIILHALTDGYKGRLMKGQYPTSVIFIEIPFDQVDVNVHPTKNEVRFANQNMVHSMISKAISESLGIKESFGHAPFSPEEKQSDSDIFKPAPYFIPGNEKASDFKEIQTEFIPRKESYPSLTQTPLWDKKQFKDLKIIGQLHNTYILCEDNEGLILIDQHAAHERIVYEQLKKNSETSKNQIQKLLLPETLEVGYKEAPILDSLLPSLNKFGIEIEPFGGNTFIIKSVPTLLSDKAIKPLIINILEKMAEINFTKEFEKAIDESLMIIACHSAIRANKELSNQEIKMLLTKLDEADIPFHCPHGRPTWIKWSKSFLEKSFGRIV